MKSKTITLSETDIATVDEALAKFARSFERAAAVDGEDEHSDALRNQAAEIRQLRERITAA